VLVIGEKGSMFAPGDYCEYGGYLFGVDKPKVEFQRSPGHFEEWVRAIRGGEEARSNFPNYAGPLTETVLLGNLAVWCAPDAGAPGKKVEWDAENFTAKNAPEAEHLVRAEYHNGYKLT
jgi:hypothetical protein